MARENNDTNRTHTLSIEEGGATTITAVKSVPNFDSDAMDIVLDTENMRIEGEHIEIDRLDLDAGVLVIEGKVKSVTYSHGKIARGVLSRIFK